MKTASPTRRYRGHAALTPTTPIVPTTPLRSSRFLSAVVLSTALAGGPVLPVTFPTTDLAQRTMIALTPDLTIPWWEWGWTDITPYVRWDPGITITYGRTEENARVSSLNADMLLDNRDSRFSRGNPFGPYAGFLDRATPIWSQVNPGSGWITILQGYVNSWPKRWDTTGSDANMPITVGGIMRRYTITDESRSAMTRTMVGYTPSGSFPAAVWPMEDGEDAFQFASAIPGVAPMILGGDITLGTSDEIVGSLPLPVWQAGSNATGVVPDHADAGRWSAAATVLTPADLVLQNVAVTVFNAQVSGGTYSSVSVGITPGAQLALVTRDASGTVVNTWTDTFPSDRVFGEAVTVSVTATDDASGTDDGWAANLIAADGTILASISQTSGAGHYGQIRRILPNGSLALASDTVIGETGVWVDGLFEPGVDDVEIAKSIAGHDGETTVARMRRECRAAGVPFYCTTDESAQLGPQPEGTLQDVLNNGEKADGGVLFEHEFGYGFKPRAEFLLPPVALALDQALGQVAGEIEADDDDTRFVNQFTAKRPDGSFATVRDPAYRRGKALVTGSDTYNVYSDEQLLDLASLAVAEGTLEADRWPRISLNLANHPELIPDWAAMPQFGRVTVENPFEQAAVTRIDVIAEGATVHVNSRQWDVDLNNSPAALLNGVGVWGSDDGSDTDTLWGADDTTLAAAITDAQTAITVDAGDDVWAVANTVTEPETFPFDIDIGPPGASLTYSCTEVAGTHPNLTLTIVRLGTDRAWPAGTPVTVTDTGIWG